MVEIVVNPITRQDRDRWAELWLGYLDFYETRLPPEIYDHTWQRLIAADGPIRGLGARLGSASAPLAGIAHYLFHACLDAGGLLSPRSVRQPHCPARGVGRQLIEAVAGAARDRGCSQLYWTTKEDNAAARSLYGRIAGFNGFIRFDCPLA